MKKKIFRQFPGFMKPALRKPYYLFEEFILQLFVKYGLRAVSPVHYGSWCGRDQYLSCQDIMITGRA